MSSKISVILALLLVVSTSSAQVDRTPYEAFNHMIAMFTFETSEYGLNEAFRGVLGTGKWEANESSLEGFIVSLGYSRKQAITAIQNIISSTSI